MLDLIVGFLMRQLIIIVLLEQAPLNDVSEALIIQLS